MRYTIIGIALGIIIGLIPLNSYETGIQIFTEWFGSLSKINNTKVSPYDFSKDSNIGIDTDNSLLILKGNGEVKYQKVFDEGVRHASSGNFENFIKYEKLGKDIKAYLIIQKSNRIVQLEKPTTYIGRRDFTTGFIPDMFYALPLTVKHGNLFCLP